MINVEKCEASWIGRAINRTSKLVKCKWTFLTKSCIKILGIHFSYNKALAEKENFYNLIRLSYTIKHMETKMVIFSWKNSGI